MFLPFFVLGYLAGWAWHAIYAGFLEADESVCDG
jgi:hypothetical protein